MGCPFRLTPQCLGDGRDEIVSLGHGHSLWSPCGCVLGVSGKEQQPG